MTLLFATTALAQPIDPQHYHPTATLTGLSTVKGAESQAHLDGTLRLSTIYVREPLTIVDNNFNNEQALVSDRIDLVVSYAMGLDIVPLTRLGIIKGFDLAAIVPFVPWQKETAALNNGNIVAGEGGGGGLADPRIQARITLPIPDALPLEVAFIPVLSFPTAAGSGFLGSGSVTFTPEFAGSLEVGPVLLAANMGLRVRNNKSVDMVDVGDQFLWRAGAGLDVGKIGGPKDLTVSLESYGLSNLKNAFSRRESPTEFVVGGAYRIGDFVVNAGTGTGLNRGYGAPKARVILGAAWAPRVTDSDGDGLDDDVDGCPMEAEDRDSFMDEDGCPDEDNDGDSILDVSDRCPLRAEDPDGFEDKDGCPDVDNDQDGIQDEGDKCPNDPEDVDEFQDDDGCPEADNDQDGIPDDKDACPLIPEDMNGVKDDDGCPDSTDDTDKDGLPDMSDKCPTEPEDKDEFQDEDGCPDPDNDGDGVLDVTDKCPIEAEDLDQFMDEDGCPEEDNDGDGIWDEKDECPNEPETVNGIDDVDGCPDKVELVKLTAEKIEIKEKVFFDSGSATIQERSFELLRQVAEVLKKNDTLRIRVEGHTDDRGSAAFNQDLSQKRASSVQKFLVDQGIDASRLEAVGYGEERPVASNQTERGRDTNRRVEFTVIQPEESQE